MGDSPIPDEITSGARNVHPSPNTAYIPPNLNIQSIPNQPNLNTYAYPGGANPNYTGKISVDTASLAAFGQWVADELHEPLSKLTTQLQAVQVEPGAFYWADYIRSYVNGTSNTTGLKNNFITVIEELLDGLDGISKGVTTLSQKYTDTEELNSASANDLATDFGSASSYFGDLSTELDSGKGGS